MDTAIWRMLGENMRLLRKGAGSTLTEAARQVGYSKSHLCLVELGRDRPSDQLVRRYDETFGGDGLLRSIYDIARVPRLGDGPLDEIPVPPGARATRGDRSEFVADLTVPDGSPVVRDTLVTKVWQLRNAGVVAWHGRRLVRRGPRTGTTVIGSPAEVPVPDTEPGDEVEIAVELRAPMLPGTAMALFKMLDAEGRLAFPELEHGIYAVLTVV